MNFKKVIERPSGNFFFVMSLLFVILPGTLQVSAQPLARGKDKFAGCGTSSPVPAGFDNYWNQVTPGNEGKWGSVEGTRDSYNWTGLDQIYNYALLHGIHYKHHTLIWGSQQPGWISTLDSASQRAEIEEWIRLVGERYPLMDYVDVVNEPLAGHNPPDGGGSPARANYVKALGGSGKTGWDWVIKSFELARRYCAPGVKLLLNEYGIINDNNATSNYLTIINLLKARNLIDGIGVQGHRFELMNKDTAVLRYNLDRLAATGFPVYITEFDLGTDNNSVYDPNVQLSEYRRIFPVLWNHPGVKGITWWGYIQGQMWQVNTYLLYSNSTDTPAMTWLRSFLTTGNYRSHQTGNWSDVNTWEKFDGSNWISPVPAVPALINGSTGIQAGHTVTVTANDSARQVSVLAGGTLVINSGVDFLIKNGTDDGLNILGAVNNYGNLIKEPAAAITIAGTGKYEHRQDGGTVPFIKWGTGSTCELTGIVNTMPSNMNQNFYHVKWNCPDQAMDMSLGWENGVTIGGTFSVASTNWNRASMTAPSHYLQFFNGPGSCTVGGLQISGHSAVTSGSTDTVVVNGDLTFTGGSLFLLSTSSVEKTIVSLKGNLTVMDSASLGSSATANSSQICFSNAGVQTLSFPASGTNLIGSLNMTVGSGSILDVGTNVVGGSGWFRVDSGAALQTKHVNGIDGNIQCTGTAGGGNYLSSDATYIYNGTTAQVTGSLLPGTVANLTINNPAGVTLTNSLIINGILEMKAGSVLLGGRTLRYEGEGSLKYSGLSPQTTSDSEFPAADGPKNLIINSNYGITLHATRSLGGQLNFLLGKLMLGTNTLSASGTTNGFSNRYASTVDGGALKLRAVGGTPTLFPVGISTYTPVTITNTGIPDDIAVGVVGETTPAPYGGRVNAKWQISESTPGGGNYTLQLGWSLFAENAAFKTNRAGYARIFSLPDTVEAGTGAYTTQFTSSPYTVSRSGITALGSFIVGGFSSGTGVDENEITIPKKYVLSQNYPNPFNPVTQIHYSIPRTSTISLKVYNLLGQEMATMFEGVRQPGNYDAPFDGSTLTSGVYLYRLTAGTNGKTDFVETRKFMLVK